MAKKIDYIPKRILIIKLKKLGDVIGTTAVTRQIRELYPEAEITFLTEPLGAQVYENSSHINHLWILNRKPSFIEYSKLCFKVYKNKFDLVIDLYDHHKTALLTLLSMAKYRLGFTKFSKKSISYNYTVSLTLEEQINSNRIEHQLKLTNVLGTNMNDCAVNFNISEQTREFGTQFSELNGITNKTIAFCVQSERDGAQVPTELFIQIGEFLIEHGYKLYFVYGPGEKNNALTVYNALSKKSACLIDYEMPAVGEVRAIFENCAMYIGNDGGNKHIAVTSNICSIGLFYGDNPKVWTPNEPRMHRYLQTKNAENSFDEFTVLFGEWSFDKNRFPTP